jgi:Holliday junction resolvasome RuvABC DNA-binding subunit
MTGWARLVLVDAAIGESENADGSLVGMVREIKKVVCGQITGGEAADATAALVKLGIPKPDAERRIMRILADNPNMPASDIITEALRKPE